MMEHEREGWPDRGCYETGMNKLGPQDKLVDALARHAERLVTASHRLENMVDRVFGASADCAKTPGTEDGPTLTNQFRKAEIFAERITLMIDRLEQAL